jgi:hypothetical protein
MKFVSLRIAPIGKEPGERAILLCWRGPEHIEQPWAAIEPVILGQPFVKRHVPLQIPWRTAAKFVKQGPLATFKIAEQLRP